MTTQLEDKSAGKILDANVPLEYGKFDGQSMTRSTPTSHRLESKEKDVAHQSPANTVSTVASSIVSASSLLLTPPFVLADDEDHIRMCSSARTAAASLSTVPLPRDGLRTALRDASLVHECGRHHHDSCGGIDSISPEANEEASLLFLLRRELDETKEALRELQSKVERKDLGSYKREEYRADQDDLISTTSTEAVSGGEILHSDPWNDSIRSFVSSCSGPLEFLTVPEEVSVVSRTLDTPSEAVQAVQTELKKSARHAKLLEAKLRASEAVASTLFRSLTDIRKKQREMERLNKDRASCEDVELMLHHSLLLLCMGPVAVVFLAGGYAELFAAIVFVLFFSLEVVSEDTASS